MSSLAQAHDHQARRIHGLEEKIEQLTQEISMAAVALCLVPAAAAVEPTSIEDAKQLLWRIGAMAENWLALSESEVGLHPDLITTLVAQRRARVQRQLASG